ncbi:MAG: hypothetical protein HY791_16085 [Deltaproteobacteria bacterium]|nr:hypothetical protein [Deltaproteobacteria bacterium]
MSSGGTSFSALFRDTIRLASRQVDGMAWLTVAGLLVPVISMCSLGVLAGPMFYGYARMGMRIARDEPTTLADLFEGVRTRFADTFVAFLVCTLVGMVAFGLLMIPVVAVTATPESGVLHSIGILLLVAAAMALMSVPGLTFGFLAQFTFHVMATHPGLTPTAALKASMLLVRDHVEEIAIAVAASMALAVVSSAIMVIVGGFVAAAFCVVLQSLLYDRLTGQETPVPSAL